MGFSSEDCQPSYLPSATFTTLPILYDWRTTSISGQKILVFTMNCDKVADSSYDRKEFFAEQDGSENAAKSFVHKKRILRRHSKSMRDAGTSNTSLHGSSNTRSIPPTCRHPYDSAVAVEVGEGQLADPLARQQFELRPTVEETATRKSNCRAPWLARLSANLDRSDTGR